MDQKPVACRHFQTRCSAGAMIAVGFSGAPMLRRAVVQRSAVVDHAATLPVLGATARRLPGAHMLHQSQLRHCKRRRSWEEATKSDARKQTQTESWKT